MKKALLALTSAVALTMTAGCTFHGGTDLSDVASRASLTNVTTGDGTFENYTATGHYSGTEIGISVGLPFLIKLFEIYPMTNNEDLLTQVAEKAREDGADAMINVMPAKSLYTGIPFLFVGVHLDSAEGTGIDSR